MKHVLFILLALMALNTGASDAEQNDGISTSALSLDIDSYSPPRASTIPRRGQAEELKISLGAILKSHHFNKKDRHYYNESHNGVYINVNQWSAGTYTNTAYEQSVFVTYNPTIYRKQSVTVNLVAGVANGYEDLEHAQGDYLPILGASVQWAYLKAILSYDVVVLGTELPLN